MQRTVLRAVVCALALGCLPAIMLGPDDPAPTRSVAASGTNAPAVPGPPAGTHPAARTGRPVGPPQVVPGARLPRQPITTFAVRGRAIALTFDDGPDPRWTPAVLDLLRRYHAHAVFCVVGVHVTAYPDLVRRIAREGHALCDHTWTHDQHLPRRPAARIENEIGRTAAAIIRITGVAPRYYRAPGGNWSPKVIAIARQRGLAPLGWAVDPSDWARPGTQVIIERVLGRAAPGAVVLMHDGYGRRAESLAALRVILPRLAARGYRFVLPS